MTYRISIYSILKLIILCNGIQVSNDFCFLKLMKTAVVSSDQVMRETQPFLIRRCKELQVLSFI